MYLSILSCVNLPPASGPCCPMCWPAAFDGSRGKVPGIEFCTSHARDVLAMIALGFGPGPARREGSVATQKHSRRGRAGSVIRRAA
jgi:hypothetical protein